MKKLLYILTIAVVFTSCEEIEDACASEKPASAIIFEFPDSIEASETYELNVQYVLDNNCGSFDKFDIVAFDHAYEVKLMTKYEGCNCNMEFQEESVDFDVRVDEPGVYEFKFWLADNDFDTYSLKVYD